MMITFRRFTLADLPALACLAAIVAGAEDAWSRAIEECLADHEQALPNLTRSGWLAQVDSDQLIGYNYAEIMANATETNIWLRGGVQPGWRGQGLGLELLKRSWADLEPLGRELTPKPIWINAWAYDHDQPRNQLYSRFGLKPYHRYYEMVLPAQQIQPVPALPPGIIICPWHDNDCEAAAALRNRAFSQSWGYQATTANALRRRFQSGRYEPGLSFSAWREDELVGLIHACLAGPQPAQGELVWLAVAPEMRGQGLGRALMLIAMHALRQAGAELISLGSDHYAGQVNIGLFTRLGFTVRKAIVDYRREL
jgi:mycothiol synthase